MSSSLYSTLETRQERWAIVVSLILVSRLPVPLKMSHSVGTLTEKSSEASENKQYSRLVVGDEGKTFGDVETPGKSSQKKRAK